MRRLYSDLLNHWDAAWQLNGENGLDQLMKEGGNLFDVKINGDRTLWWEWMQWNNVMQGNYESVDVNRKDVLYENTFIDFLEKMRKGQVRP